jgi:hypothetical protein
MRAGCHEPNLGELLRDPLVRQLMASDGITETAMCNLIGKVRRDRWATKENNGVDAAAFCT